VSTGGGLPLREENRALMAGMGFVVWLDAPLQAIVERVAANSRRPLLQGENLEAKVGKLLAERREVYRGSADLRVETNGLSVQEVAYGVAESVRVYFAGRESKQSD
jgi:shikimate kinase